MLAQNVYIIIILKFHCRTDKQILLFANIVYITKPLCF